MTVYCEVQCYITNSTGLSLAVQYPLANVGFGEYYAYPVPVAPASMVSAFVVQSLDGEMAGPTTGVSYQMPDGTALVVWFNQNFAVATTSQADARLSGAFSYRYNVTMKQAWWPWNGAGAYWILYLTVAPGSGGQEASCQYTR